MKPLDAIRVGRHTYLEADNFSHHEDHQSINAAKRWSRVFQKNGGVLGDGRLRVMSRSERVRVAGGGSNTLSL